MIDISESVLLPEEGVQEIDVAGLSGTKGKGYTYDVTSGYLNKENGVEINKATGKVTVTSGPDSVFLPGEQKTFSVSIKDKDGKTVGKVTITFTVNGEPAEKAA